MERNEVATPDMDLIDSTLTAAAEHAATCRTCGRPIVDDEGNPGFFGEACAPGLVLLVRYVIAIGEPVPAWAHARANLTR